MAAMQLQDDDRARYDWINRRLGQVGIDVRQRGEHTAMRYYIELLQEELRMTRYFLNSEIKTKKG